jgi:hypothetical protein
LAYVGAQARNSFSLNFWPHIVNQHFTNWRVWTVAQAINFTEKGSVFANGKSKDQWQWSAIKTIQLTEEEKSNPRFKNQAYKSDSKTLQNFGSDFIEACDYIGFFNT